MSRIDQDLDYPPGLSALPNRANTDREQGQPAYYGNTMFSTGDRRPSLGILGYPGYTSATPRSLGMHDREYGSDVGPNRHNPNPQNHPAATQFFSSFNHHHRRSSPPLSVPSSYRSTAVHERDAPIFRTLPASAANTPPVPANNTSQRSTLWWGEIEPWMDEEYAKQVCALMGWDSVIIKVPHPAPDPVTGQQANNPGFCYLTFPTATQAASVLAQINGGGNNAPVTMPNSSKPFVLNWASAVQASSPINAASSQNVNGGASQQYPKEYSIFVGDLAPETSNSDLVAVFRNPVLGLRNDREPKFIRPFNSCKSAKIMLDPVTGVSRGYGFVRFTDEADQQRALIEMHGLYCLSRPMRISPATAKYKAPSTAPSLDMPQVQFPLPMGGHEPQSHSVTIALPLPNSNLTKSVSVPIAATTSSSSLSGNSINSGLPNSGSGASIATSNSTATLSSGSSASVASSGLGSVTSESDMMNLPNNVLVQIAQQYANGDAPKPNSTSITQPFAQDTPMRQSFGHGEGGAPRYTISEESWKHHAQARAILGNLIGPNGEQLTSTDPYNTTVFVGGLSPLISEETLRTFFAPFGDIHYVKVPVGKHCGFVQFVKKADAERAIEKMQGFPVGGSRIRLSWGRSQYKAAQAAAQAAQAAALQSQYPAPAPPVPNMMTQEQAIQLLQKLNLQGYLDNVPSIHSEHGNANATSGGHAAEIQDAVLGSRDDGPHGFESFSSNGYQSRPDIHRAQSSFAPFSPDPNAYTPDMKHRDSFSRSEILPHPSKAFAPGFYPPQAQELKVNTNVSATGKTSPTSNRPSSATRYTNHLEGANPYGVCRAPGRPEVTISRPTSGQTGQNAAGQELDAVHDLNGTLASLDLDRTWMTPEGLITSSGSAQFRPTNESTPSHSN
ncbi:hypothetical protein DXG03_000047 [Asterophora parasitica]|uniref:RRM domain-containing protein n=1 Tax=Asterophora parasitica TaxID=117018 RepID=A0A9P7GJZ5_9AGAR|nr:hypothetical protein DXG03_000047 [Asterophora parasitica]